MRRDKGFRHSRYEVTKLLAEGGMGRVYLARDLLEGGRDVALKVYPASYHHARLKEEFLALKCLSHPGVARAHHFGVSETDGAPFFTLEFIRGKPLHAFVDGLNETARGRVAAQLLLQTVRAVAYLHRRRFLHLDLKPDNILVVSSSAGLPPRPVLIDFGLVRHVDDARSSISHATLPYAPPESFLGAAPTPASDVYSLAAAFYRVFSGRYPVDAGSAQAFAKSHRSRAASPLPEVPQRLERILLRALAKDSSKRFGDAGELLAALMKLDRESLLGAATEPGEILFHEPELVGRKRELAEVQAWLARGLRDHPVLEILGGSGFGKTRFLERAQTLIETRGSPVLALRATAEPGWPLLTQLATAARVLTSHRSRSQSRRIASTESARQLSRAVASQLVPLLRERLFFVIDDVHLASPLEEQWIAEAGRALGAGAPAQGGIVVSRTKTSEPATAWAQSGLSRNISLGPLALEEAMEIDLEGLDGATGSDSPGRIAALKRSLFEESGGHPLFFVRGLLDLAGGGDEAVRLAPTERLAAQARKLSGEERSVATTLGLLGREATAAEIGRLAGLGAEPTRAAIERLRWRGLVAPRGNGFRVVHESIGEALRAALDPGELAGLRSQIARRIREGGLPGACLEAAWHFLEGGDRRSGIEAALEWVTGAQSRGESSGPRGAETLLRAAEAQGESTPAGKSLLEAASDALESLGRFAECVRVRERVVSNSENGSDPDALDVRRWRKLGSVCHRAGFIERAIEHLAACVTPRAEAASSVESLRAHADLALIHHFRGETEQALAHSRRGTDVWRQSSSAARAATAQSAVNFLAVEGQILIRRLEIDEARTVLEKGLKLALKSASPANTAILLNNLALAQHLSGRLDQALATFEKAEAIAKGLFDAAALVSIRSNVVQILARKGKFQAARAILDEVEDSPAVKQSARLRLYCLYTRGLFLGLLGGPSSEIWRAVESQARETDDHFLSRFAQLYLAESHIAAGRYSDARAELARIEQDADASPGIVAPACSRLSLAEAMSGRREAARQARLRLDAAPVGPPLLSAWNQLQAGASALETGDFDEAESRLERCREVFRSTGAVIGEVECALVLADLWIRRAAASREAETYLERAGSEMAIARKLVVESPGDASPRMRELRAGILEGRMEVARWLGRYFSSQAGNGGPGNRKKAWRAATPSQLKDLIARSSGDSSLAAAPDLRLSLECLNVAAARLSGDLDGARRSAERVQGLLGEIHASVSPGELPQFARTSPWTRFGLEAFELPAGCASLEPRHAESLGRILRGLETSAVERAAVRDALGEIARALGSERVAFVPAGGAIEIAWSGAGETRERTAPEAAGRLWVACRFQGLELGLVVADARPGSPFTAADHSFLEAAAHALAPRLGPTSPYPHLSSRPGDASRTSELGLRERSSRLVGTAPISRTRRVTDDSLKSGSIARTLKEEGFVASGRETMKMLRAAASIAATEMPVLITGDSGTGKNLLARLLHRLSPRSQSPFLVQSASAVPPELFEADFFGYESGAFTGAERTRTGFLFQAEGGTFHLEEIGDLELALQQRFLRVIEERSVRPLGATDSRTLDVRFIASTQRNLEAMVRRGEFRKDLYYRLSGAQVRLPSLAQRREEIEDLVEHHWRIMTGSRARFPQAALELLRRHDWPGNVRELVSVLRRLSLETKGSPSTEEVRTVLGSRSERSQFPAEIFESKTFEEVSRLLERGYLEHLLQKHSGNLEAIASALGTTTRSIYRRFERLGLKPKDFPRQA